MTLVQRKVAATYLTQRLEYRFHTAGVIGSNPIVGNTHLLDTATTESVLSRYLMSFVVYNVLHA